MAIDLFEDEEQDKLPPLSLKAKGMLIYAKIFRFLSYAAVLIGLIVSALIYNHESGGSSSAILDRPAFLLVLCVPFIPSIVLSLIAISKTKKFYKQLQEEGIDIKALRNRPDSYSHRG